MLNANKQGNNHPSQCTKLTYAKPDSNQRSMLPLCYIYAKAQGATTTKIPRVLIITKAIYIFFISFQQAINFNIHQLLQPWLENLCNPWQKLNFTHKSLQPTNFPVRLKTDQPKFHCTANKSSSSSLAVATVTTPSLANRTSSKNKSLSAYGSYLHSIARCLGPQWLYM